MDVISLQKYISETVHPEYSLIGTLEKGIAYHHGHLPQHIRVVVEKAFSEKYIHTIACTTTLMQGVNLPAKNLIARSPYLFTRMNKNISAKLTSYEFANLRGRAGRLMKDLVGRAIILDEESFEESSDYLHDFPDKELNASYGVKFNQNKDKIINTLISGDAVNDKNDFNDLIVYIRQMVLKYDIQALDRIKKVDIDIDEKTFNEVKSQLEDLTISKNICIKNPYWDPIILDQLYINATDNDWAKIPKSPFDENFVGTMQDILTNIKNTTPYYHKKYFDIDNKKREWSIVKYAQSWSQEKSLAEILKIQDSARIDDTVALISKEVSFSLPKLLRPVIHIQDETNPILNFIEVGAYNPETRRLIEYGIPRETAVRFAKIIKTKKIPVYSNNELNDSLIKGFLNNIYDSLNYWEKIQIEDIIRVKI